MTRAAPLWTEPFPDAAGALETLCAQAPMAEVFFRADDVGPWSENFSRLIDLFKTRRTPLALCATPAWLTGPRLALLQKALDGQEHLFTILLHGYRHVNHEPESRRKCEFGPARDKAAKRRDLARGAEKLSRAFPGLYAPVFVPPWNRCDGQTLDCLAELGFAAVSRTPEAEPDPPAPLERLDVNVDLHTRKEPDPASSRQALLANLRRTLSAGSCGIMIHHPRMNDNAFDFLDILLANLSSDKFAKRKTGGKPF